MVAAGQFIGWSGNTGVGGVGNGLNEGGTVADPNRVNNHLHVAFAVFEPAKSSWTLLDPYGVYNDPDDNCYDLDKPTAHKRLFAPFFPAFHGARLSTLGIYFDYYPGMGMGCRR